MKKCSLCGIEKPLNMFNSRNDKDKYGNIKSRHIGQCKECVSEKSKQYYYNKKKKAIRVVYRFLNKENEVIYVGKTEALSHRIASHFSRGHLPKKCYEEVNKIEFIPMQSTVLMDIKEIYYINLYKPKYNSNYVADEPSFVIQGLGGDKWLDLSCFKDEDFAEIFEQQILKRAGTIFSRHRGNTYTVYLEIKANGKQKQIRQGSFKTKREADELVEKLRENRNRINSIINYDFLE